MSSIRVNGLVKIFARGFAAEEHRWISALGPLDHRSSVIPTANSIHPVFVSFERLIDGQEFAETIEEMGMLDNRRVILHGTEIIQFRNGGIEYTPAAPDVYRSDSAKEFFLTMRQI